MRPAHYSALTALVTGASSGIGEEIAKALARRGIGRMILVARSAERLQQLADVLQNNYKTAVTALPCDLSDPQAAQGLLGQVAAQGLPVDLLVNNAGFGSAGPFETLTLEREAQMVSLNALAVVTLTRAALPGILARGQGGVINVASTAAFQPTPYMATYGATKAFVLSFTEALAAEMQDQGRRNIRVSCLCPGATATEFGQNAGGDRGRFENVPAANAKDVAEAGIAGWERGQVIVIPALANRLGAVSSRLAPRAAVARMAAAMLRPQSVTSATQASKAPYVVTLGLLAGGLLLRATLRGRQDA